MRSKHRQQDAKNMLTYQQASALLELPLGTLYAFVSRREIPHVRLGRRLVRFPVDELRLWIEQRLVPVNLGQQRRTK